MHEQIFAAIKSYVEDKVNCGMLVHKSMIILVKEIEKGGVVVYKQPPELERLNELVNDGNEENELQNVLNTLSNILGTEQPLLNFQDLLRSLLNSLGTKYPLLSYENDSLCVQYGGVIVLDCAHPQFFTRLDNVLNHIMNRDSLSDVDFVLTTDSLLE